MLADGSIDVVKMLTQPAVLFVMGVALATWGIVQMRRRAKRVAKTATPQRTVPTASEIGRVAHELDSLLAELHETSRVIAAKIDNRVTKLETLLAEADEKIRRLEALRKAGGTTEDTESTERRRVKEAAGELDLRQRRVYELADRGHSAQEIARALGVGVGEVELVLNLRRQGSAAGGS